MNNEQQLTIIAWLKRIAGLMTFIVWIYVMTTFLKNPAPFSELAPYCMGSTMLIFGVLTGIFKGLEYWEIQIKEKNNKEENC
jgi:peptidoglycan/LPS O-acetylase OafA/YrhL